VGAWGSSKEKEVAVEVHKDNINVHLKKVHENNLNRIV